MKTMKIVSDGTARNTKIITAAGEELMNVTSIHWYLDAKTGMARVKMEFDNIQVELVGEVHQ